MLKKKRHLLYLFTFAVLLICMNPGNGFAKQPESSYWYPDALLNWSPETDPHAEFNRSSIPLAEREILFNINDTQQSDSKIVALSALNPNTSGVPSQGGNSFFANTFSYWQYVDIMVYWAGSAGEGIITPPSADVIDASHKNGVPILGNVFFPPKVYGGQDAWVEQMLSQREDGSFPAADKLLEVADYYGFDGWFINQETEGGTPAVAEKMQQFLIYLQENKPEDMHIMWYDSMVEDGSIRWQNYLTDRNKMFLQDGETRVSDSMFLNFWWWNNSQERSYQKALDINRDPYDLFAGIDVEANGTNTTVSWDNLFPQNGSPYASLGIYRPDWAFKTTDNMEDFYKKEQQFWVGNAGNPSKTNENPDNWKGMAHYFTESTVINQLPFVTNFNTGSGKFFAIDGQKKSQNAWNNRSLQDILPTWRWLAESNGKALDVDFDWEEAYYGGSSLKVSGALSMENATHVKLYKTNLPINKDTEVYVTYKSSDKKPNMKLGVSFLEDPEAFEFLDIKKKSHGEWTTERIKLKKFAGENLAAISLFFESDKLIEDYSVHIGELKVTNKHSEKVLPEKPAGVTVHDITYDEGLYADIALKWDVAEDVKHYEIYRHLSNGKKEFVGAIPNNVYYISQLRRDQKESVTKLEVVSVNHQLERSKKGQTVTFVWPDYPKPKAEFSASKSIAAPGEEIQFFNQSSEATEEVEWVFEGATPSSSKEQNPVVIYQEEGIFSVKLIAKNSEGEDVLLKEGFITITEEASNISNVALNKAATASGQCGAAEAPRYAVDGKVTDNSKWCAFGASWLQLDLGDLYQISHFVLKHAEAGGEPAAFNTRAFTIEVSKDGETWETAVTITSNSDGISEHTIPLTEARYVRLSVQQPTQGGDQATRIFEFEAYGF
ncbi:discoidin domain-containing protein [Bacillus haimaensis]|uniref:endo-beta-N-acetylglucosaminidase n=1 Tax=Bacillus haimaensis TaxID=3160967 RepID=UPI003AA8D79D